MGERMYWLTLVGRKLSAYGTGSGFVRTVNVTSASAHTENDAAKIGLDKDQVTGLIDALCAMTHHYPEDPNLDRQRERIRLLSDELREARADGEPLAALALSRHVGHQLADAAEMIASWRDHMADRTVAELAAELAGLLDAVAYGKTATNDPEHRIELHRERIAQLRDQLPPPGEEPTP